jgi:hypothetical protein
MREAGFHHRIDICFPVEPVKKRPYFFFDAWRRFEVDALLSYRTANNLHRSLAVVAPRPYPDLAHAATPGGKEAIVPCEQPFISRRLIVMACRVKHHFNDAFYVTVCWFEGADIHSQAAGNR